MDSIGSVGDIDIFIVLNLLIHRPFYLQGDFCKRKQISINAQIHYQTQMQSPQMLLIFFNTHKICQTSLLEYKNVISKSDFLVTLIKRTSVFFQGVLPAWYKASSLCLLLLLAFPTQPMFADSRKMPKGHDNMATACHCFIMVPKDSFDC